jgi:FkbM family methyltransferase
LDGILIVERPRWHALKGKFGRGRRELRRRLLEPLLLRRPALRDVVMRALASRGHLILCDLGDVRLFVDPGDRAIGASLLWQGSHQRAEFERAVALVAAAGRLRADGVFVDVGANIGTHTIYALLSGKFARAVAFEPEPRNARLLAMNLDLNGYTERTAVVAKAAGAAEGRVALHLHPRNKGAHAIGFAPAADGRDRLEVPLVRLDRELRELGVAATDIGLVWMDVEGYEPQALEGLGDVLARAVPIVFEFSPHRYDAATKERLVRRLAASYTHLHRLSDPADRATPVGALAAIDRVDDVLLY